MKLTFAGLLCVVLFGVTSSATAKDNKELPPNIVMIISDDQGWTDYSFMGHPHIRTPHLDRLASQSLVFPRGYVPSSLCCPSLASIVTGRFPHEHKVTGNDPPIPPSMTAAAFRNSDAFQSGRDVMIRHLEAMPTLPRLLAQRGYVSLQTGKWWQGHYSRGGFTSGMTKGSRHGDDGLDIGRKTMQPIFDFIQSARHDRKPFFVWYAPMMPHLPHNAPARLVDKYKDKTTTLNVAKYWASVEWFDETVGELLNYLDKHELAQNTVVLFVTDNGWIQDAASPECGPKSKQSPCDGGVRTPIMIRWLARVTPFRSESLASSLDLLPTILAAAEIKAPARLPGVNLLDSKKVAARRSVFGECFTHNIQDHDRPASGLRWRWIVEGDWKLIVPASQNEPDSSFELYNLAKDPHEETNLATTQAAQVKRLQRRLDSWWRGR